MLCLSACGPRLGAERDKVSYLQQRLEDRFKLTDLPRMTFGTGPGRTVRYFPDKVPIGTRLREDSLVFLYPSPSPCRSTRIFLSRHAPLLLALPEWTLRLLAPGSLRTAVPRYLHAVREEYTDRRSRGLSSTK